MDAISQPLALTAEKLALLFGLSFFFGLAFEEFFVEQVKRPGGVRTFPLLALAGAGLYLLQPSNALPFSAGLLILGAWLFVYYRASTAAAEAHPEPGVSLIVPVCSLLAYILGPLAIAAPPWIAVSYAVAGVLLLWGRQRLHELARTVPAEEIVTLGKFLILTGIVLPVLPDQPVVDFLPISPYRVWLAVVAVSAISYASYLVQRYLLPARGALVAAVLGGLYSSTVTTTVLAREAAQQPERRADFAASIVLATAIMYVRIGAVIAAFNWQLAWRLLPSLLGLLALAVALAALCYGIGRGSRPAGGTQNGMQLRNPLELGAAVIFAALFIVISLASSWVRQHFGTAGEYWLAAVVGVTDVDPFVLSLAQNATDDPARSVGMVAVLIAAASNNLLKAGYAIAYAGFGIAAAAAALVALALAGGGLAMWLAA